jgi:VanZ family protein
MPASINTRFIKYWLPVPIYAILIFYISSVPGDNIPSVFPYQDIVFHIIEYAGFALFLSRALKEYYPKKTRLARFLWVFLAAILYAASDEFHQSFIYMREASAMDLGYDSIGIFLANAFYR